MSRLTFWKVSSHDLCDHVHLWFRAKPGADSTIERLRAA